ncbi:MAG: EAL domain-containing protein [Pseudomonadota bacterium]
MNPRPTSDVKRVQESLANRLRDLNRLHRPLWVYDIDHAHICWGNSSCLEMWQSDSLDELLSRNLAEDMTETVATRLRQYQADFERDETCQFQEVWTLYPGGKPRTVDVVFSGIRLDDGRMAMFCEVGARDDMDADALRSAEALMHTSVMITLFSAAGLPLYRNPAARANARSGDETLADHFVDPSTMHLLNHASVDEINTVASVHTARGQCWHDISASRCLDAVSGEHAWLISEVDVSRLKATEERAQFLAEHDTLTGLPNRNYVSVSFQNRIDRLMAVGEQGALIFIDLDHFKDINDTLGHNAGDQLLIEIANRLRSVIRKGDAVARLGGDEFLLLLGQVENRDEVLEIVNRVRDITVQPMDIHERRISVTPSIGISLFPANGRNIEDLLRHADLAMYHAKDSGRNDYSFFSQDLSDAVESRISLEAELCTALRENQFVTHFQPRVDVQTNTITGAEALVRWLHPSKGLVPPATFIPVCEASGLIGKLGRVVFADSVRAQRRWAEQGYNLRVSVNLSPLQFGEDNLVDDLLSIVDDEGGDIDRIELEITESVLLGHDSATINKLNSLVDRGFRIAIDDFGTGYSNLAYLHRYPLRCLKIDRSFIQSLDSAQPIVELIVSMAELFRLDVVAEGVETEAQLEALRGYNCQEYQGFLFERPIDFDAFTELLERQKLQRSA